MSFLTKHFHKFLLLWTGKTSLMALVTLLGLLPAILLSIPAGELAGRYDRRLLTVIGDNSSPIGLLFIRRFEIHSFLREGYL